MSDSSTETVPVVLAQEQLLQLASAVATSLTAYFEAREEESTVVVAEPVAVTVTEGVPAADPQEGGPAEPAEGEEAAAPEATGPVGAVAEETESPEETDPDAGTDTEPTGTDTGTTTTTEETAV